MLHALALTPQRVSCDTARHERWGCDDCGGLCGVRARCARRGRARDGGVSEPRRDDHVGGRAAALPEGIAPPRPARRRGGTCRHPPRRRAGHPDTAARRRARWPECGRRGRHAVERLPLRRRGDAGGAGDGHDARPSTCGDASRPRLLPDGWPDLRGGAARLGDGGDTRRDGDHRGTYRRAGSGGDGRLLRSPLRGRHSRRSGRYSTTPRRRTPSPGCPGR